MDNKITEQEAIKFIEENPNEDWFIQENYQLRQNRDGDADDNTIGLSDYWRECKSIVGEYLSKKHG